jgi:poly(3-hydroxybutyrate) depolymerase
MTQPMTESLFYARGATPFYACQADPRFSFCLYVPRVYHESPTRRFPLAVIVHGTGRVASEYRNAFADFAEANDCVILAPLFPGGITAPWELNSYKWMKAGDLRFDHVLLKMIEEVGEHFRVETERFLIHGFSGGGHFAHRFFYLHPHRLLGVSIGAPGVVTLLDDEHDFWVGTRDLEAQFGTAIDLEAMRRVPVLMTVGGDDTETWEITITPESRLFMPGADLAGANRQDRMRSLKASYERQGIAVRHVVVPGVGHEGFTLLDPVKTFFAETLSAARQPALG